MKRKNTDSLGDVKRLRHASPPIEIKKEEARLPLPQPSRVNTPNATPTTLTTYDQLLLIHKSLCTIYTFLSARPHFLASFEKISPTVSSQIGRPLEQLDIAKIKTIIPQDLLFGYVVVEPEDAMQLKETGLDDSESLLIEFVDGKLRASNQSKAQGQHGQAMNHAYWKSLRIPIYGVKSMQNLIRKRIARFEMGLKKYMKKYGTAWAEQLNKDATNYLILQVSKAEEDPVEAMVTAGHRSHGSKEANAKVFNIPNFIQAMKKAPEYHGQIVENGEFVVPEQEAAFGELNNPLPEAIQIAIGEHLGLDDAELEANPVKLYTHQAEAINQLDQGYNVVVATSTSSGKSMIYQIPILRALFEWHEAGARGDCPTAIFIFPTKALAQDQMRSFNALKFLVFDSITAASITAETYDGDTPAEDRTRIRQTASVIFTNPDMIHANILPNWENTQWRQFIGALRYVVVDELHTYTGVFGAHVAYVMRRLRRVYEECRGVVEKNFQVISCSATISEPKQVRYDTTEIFSYGSTCLTHLVDARSLWIGS